MEENKASAAHIQPMQLTGESRFQFECGKDLSCFTQCCRGLDLVLTPYDIIRLKHRLGLDSEQFLAIYTQPRLLLQTDLPVPTLKLLDDEESSCPFVRDDGCILYTDRPTACRYYPIGSATMRPQYADQSENWYFFVKEPHCKGFEVEKEWTVDEWRTDQDVVRYDEANAPWYDLVVRKRSIPHNVKFNEKAKSMFFMASYNMDQFRRFVFESSFLNLFDLDKERIGKVREDDVALLHLGCDWIRGVMFKQGPFQPDEETAKKREAAQKSE
ncbi:MAG: YkgJ family cysteine cluster protein [Desulfatibacillaceae bacterium]